jgi:single-strand DNA-binding protein
MLQVHVVTRHHLMNYNKVIIAGNLTRDPEIRFTSHGKAVGEINIAINRVWNNERGERQEESTFVEVTIWGRQAETAQQYLTKGRGVLIEGRLHLDVWDDKATGQKRTKLKVVAEAVQFMPSKGGADQSRGALPPAGTTHAGRPIAAMDDSLDEDDSIPF